LAKTNRFSSLGGKKKKNWRLTAARFIRLLMWLGSKTVHNEIQAFDGKKFKRGD